MFNSLPSNYSTDVAIKDAGNSVNSAHAASQEAIQAINSTRKLLGEKMFNPLEIGSAIGRQIAGAGQQPSNDDFDQKLQQEHQRARNTPGLEQYAKQIESVARFRAQGMGGAMQGSELANQAIGQESQLRANQEYQMGQQQKAMEWATGLKREMERDQSNQAYSQNVGMTRLNQDYGREQNIRQTKADQAKSLLDSYVNGRQQAMNFAQNSFRSLI